MTFKELEKAISEGKIITVKELKTSISNGEIDQSHAEKLQIVLDATYVLTSDIRKVFMGKPDETHKNTYAFLNHKNFRNTILNVMLQTLEDKNNLNCLKRTELSLISTEALGSNKYMMILDKIHTGIIHHLEIEQNKKECNEETCSNLVYLQGILINYCDSIKSGIQL